MDPHTHPLPLSPPASMGTPATATATAAFAHALNVHALQRESWRTATRTDGLQIGKSHSTCKCRILPIVLMSCHGPTENTSGVRGTANVVRNKHIASAAFMSQQRSIQARIGEDRSSSRRSLIPIRLGARFSHICTYMMAGWVRLLAVGSNSAVDCIIAVPRASSTHPLTRSPAVNAGTAACIRGPSHRQSRKLTVVKAPMRIREPASSWCRHGKARPLVSTAGSY